MIQKLIIMITSIQEEHGIPVEEQLQVSQKNLIGQLKMNTLSILMDCTQ